MSSNELGRPIVSFWEVKNLGFAIATTTSGPIDSEFNNREQRRGKPSLGNPA